MDNVTVLMSTYNGEKYIEEQIDSILNQKNVNVKIIIRDDGSKDGTRTLIKRYSENMSNVVLIEGINIGWKKSFFSLLENVKVKENEYYSFADQDDVWNSEKLYEAVQSLKKNMPMLYFSSVTTVDEEKNLLDKNNEFDFKPTKKRPQFFFNTYGIGATIVFNEKFLAVVNKHKVTQEITHDGYLVTLAYLLGEVVSDKKSHILYRRHGGNAAGWSGGNLVNPGLAARYKRYKNAPKFTFSSKAKELLLGYENELNNEDVKLLKKVALYRNNKWIKYGLLFNPFIRASKVRTTLQIKYRILCNTL